MMIGIAAWPPPLASTGVVANIVEATTPIF